jgi:hypothetical protein
MKLNNIYLKILRNISMYSSNLCYEGDKVIRINKDNQFFIEAYIPDFLDVPLYTRNVPELLRLMNEDTTVTVDMNNSGYYIIVDNGIGKVKYKMAKKSVAEKEAKLTTNDIDGMFSKCEEKIVKFNLPKEKYDELMKISKMLEADRISISSLNDNVIRLTSYIKENKDDKQYFVDIEVNHTHFEKKLVFQLKIMDFVNAIDYTFEVGTKLTKNKDLSIPIAKVTAFIDDKIKVKYLSLGDRERV